MPVYSIVLFICLSLSYGATSHKKKWLVFTLQNDSLTETFKEEMTSRLRSELVKSFKVSVIDRQSLEQGLRVHKIRSNECNDSVCVEKFKNYFKVDEVVRLNLISTDSNWILQGWIENNLTSREVIATQKKSDENNKDIREVIVQWSEKALPKEISIQTANKEDEIFLLRRPVESLLILGGLIQLGLAQVENQKAFDSYQIMKLKWNAFKMEGDSIKSEVLWNEYLVERRNVLSKEKKRNYYWLGSGVAALLTTFVWIKNTPMESKTSLNLNMSKQSLEFSYAF
jgi:hypothetical protein